MLSNRINIAIEIEKDMASLKDPVTDHNPDANKYNERIIGIKLNFVIRILL